VYGSYPPGRLWKYDPAEDRIFDLQHLRLPITYESRTMANPMLDRRAQWRVVEWDPETRSAYGIVGGSNVLFRYDVHHGAEGRISELAQMCAPMYRGGDPFLVPHATLAMTISHKQRKIYYLPVIAGDFDYGAVSFASQPLQDLGEGLPGGVYPPLSYLVSYDLKQGRLADIGLLRADDGRLAYGMGGAESDGQGRIWFVGAFEEPDSQYVAGRMSDRFPYSMGLGCYDPRP